MEKGTVLYPQEIEIPEEYSEYAEDPYLLSILVAGPEMIKFIYRQFKDNKLPYEPPPFYSDHFFQQILIARRKAKFFPCKLYTSPKIAQDTEAGPEVWLYGDGSDQSPGPVSEIMKKTVSIDSFRSIDSYPKHRVIDRIYFERQTPRHEYLVSISNQNLHRWIPDFEAKRCSGFQTLLRNFQNQYEQADVVAYTKLKNISTNNNNESPPTTATSTTTTNTTTSMATTTTTTSTNNNGNNNSEQQQYFFSASYGKNFVCFIDMAQDEKEKQAIERIQNCELCEYLKFSLINLAINLSNSSESNYEKARNSDPSIISIVADQIQLNIDIIDDFIYGFSMHGISSLHLLLFKYGLEKDDSTIGLACGLIISFMRTIPFKGVFHFPFIIKQLFNYINEFDLIYLVEDFQIPRESSVFAVVEFLKPYKKNLESVVADFLFNIESRDTENFWETVIYNGVPPSAKDRENTFCPIDFLAYQDNFLNHKPFPKNELKNVMRHVRFFREEIILNQLLFDLNSTTFDFWSKSEYQAILKALEDYGYSFIDPLRIHARAGLLLKSTDAVNYLLLKLAHSIKLKAYNNIERLIPMPPQDLEQYLDIKDMFFIAEKKFWNIQSSDITISCVKFFIEVFNLIDIEMFDGVEPYIIKNFATSLINHGISSFEQLAQTIDPRPTYLINIKAFQEFLDKACSNNMPKEVFHFTIDEEYIIQQKRAIYGDNFYI